MLSTAICKLHTKPNFNQLRSAFVSFPWESADIKEVIKESTHKLHRNGNSVFLYIKVCKGAEPRLVQGSRKSPQQGFQK